MLDEAPGPEEGKSKDLMMPWMRAMADASNMNGDRMTREELYQKKFQEVLEPEWRSEEASLVFHA